MTAKRLLLVEDDRALLGLHLERIELLVIEDHLLGALEVALDEAAHGVPDRMFGKAAHLADERAQALQILVECLERMFAGLLHDRSNQP